MTPMHTDRSAVTAPFDATMLIGGDSVGAERRIDVRNPARPDEVVGSVARGTPDAAAQLMQSIRAGSSGKWGPVPMPPFAGLGDAELDTLAKWIPGR